MMGWEVVIGPSVPASMGVVGMPGLDHLLGTEAEEGSRAVGGGVGGLLVMGWEVVIGPSVC